MKRVVLTCLIAALTFPVFAYGYWQAAAPGSATIDAATADPDFTIQGEYVTAAGTAEQKGVQVVAQGEDSFRVVVYTGGLPGAGWDHKVPQILEDEDSGGVQDLLKSLQVEKTNRSSPTLGETPPKDALVLFDGSAESIEANWAAGAKLTPEGFLTGPATTKELFHDYRLHLEFRIPFMPKARGQQRGNSGVYHLGRYETQVLDSFGLQGKNNETGGIYEVRDPDLNMCLPPLSWQTYDVDVTAPRFDAAGKKTSDARLTVRLNGVVVQRDVGVKAPTRAAPIQESPADGPIYLQDHGSAVAFRNIWVMPRDAEHEMRRPRLPGYERFLALSDRQQEGGLILLGELGCISCHAADDTLKAELLPKQAPNLTNIGSRVRLEWLTAFIADPHHVKPGTTMPQLFAGWSDAERNQAVSALASFLTDGQFFQESAPDPRSIARGEVLFHSVGCVACHAPQNGHAVPEATSVSLDGIADKYSIGSLTQFLKAPHEVRPSGRMPSLNLKQDEPEHIAHYLLRRDTANLPPNVHFKVYHGSWDQLPNFDELKPVLEGECRGFDISKAGRQNDFGMRFEGYLPRMKSLTAEFGLGSDDGARLVIDKITAMDTDGIHPFGLTRKTVRLEDVKIHHVRVDYFERAGEEELVVTVSSDGKTMSDLGMMLQLTPEVKQAATSAEKNPAKDGKPQIDPKLVEQGRACFTSLGCANCHEIKRDDKRIKSALAARPLRELDFNQGCLAEQPASTAKHPLPDYDLTAGQRRDLRLAGSKDAGNLNSSPQVRIDRTMIAFNCYACHEREGQGGPESSRNELFQSTEKEMGDEGRLAPILTGVGDKLQDGWLKTVLNKGSKNRPYMLTRMPAFGERNVGHLAAFFIALDRRDEAEAVKIDEPLHRVKATGRSLVGNGGLACIKCHDFGDKHGTGIRAVSLTEMTGRIREDWFQRYLIDPVKYRPGTRMPTGFPNGQAVVKDVYHGNPAQQVSAIWTYLQDGDRAGIPDGLVAAMIELKPESEPIIYRNFLEETSPRGIAVGYPEKANLIWDADALCLKRVWHDRFIDASKHWTGRGAGTQGPLGDHIINIDPTLPLARLATPETAWPQEAPRSQPGYQFKGYSLNDKGQPAFSYVTPFADVSESFEPQAVNEHEGTFRRKFHLRAKPDIHDLYFRAASGAKISSTPEGYRVGDTHLLRFTGGGTPLVRQTGDQQELLIPLSVSPEGIIELTEEIIW